MGVPSAIRITNPCDLGKVALPFLPIVEAAVEAYRASVAPGRILDIRLMGSVPRGEARVGESDIDFALVVSHPLDPGEARRITEAADRLSGVYPQVRRVDLEVEVAGAIHPAREFVFRTDSISVFGNDLYPRSDLRVDPRQVAATNTPDLDGLVTAYRRGVVDAAGDAEVRQFSRWIGKDILKAFRYRLLMERGIYERSAVGIRDRLVEAFPGDTSLFEALLGAYRDPTTDRAALSSLLDQVEDRAAAYRAAPPRRTPPWLLGLPWALLWSRAAVGPLILGLALWPDTGPVLAALVVFGVLTDVFDGIAARRLRVSTEGLRKVDSRVDVAFFGFCVVGLLVRSPELWGWVGLMAALLAALEVTVHTISWVRFGKESSTHHYLSKGFALALFGLVVQFSLWPQITWWYAVTLGLGVLSYLESGLIMLTLPEWRCDVRSIFDVWKEQRGGGSPTSPRGTPTPP